MIIPVPAPTTPSATGPSTAASIAARPSATVTLRRRESSSHESLHSPTTGADDVVVADARGTASNIGVDDGVVDAPDRRRAGQHDRRVEEPELGRSRSSPVSSPTPLSTATRPPAAGGTRSSRVGGRIAVTPVRATAVVDQHVTWPTRTPGTSVIALWRPVGSSPKSRPSCAGAAEVRWSATSAPASSGAQRAPHRARAEDVMVSRRLRLSCRTRGVRRGEGPTQRPPSPSRVVPASTMPVVWTTAPPRARADGGYWLGVRLRRRRGARAGRRPRRPARGAPASTLVEPAAHGLEPDPRRARPGVRRLPLAGPGRRWVAEGHLEDPGQPQVVPYLFATGPVRGPPSRRPAPGDDPRRGRAVRDGHDVADQRRDVRRRVRGRRLRASRRPISSLAGAPAAYAAVRPPGHHAGPAFFGGSCYLNNAAIAAQRLPRPAASTAGRDRRHRRPPGQRHPGDLLRPRRRDLRQRPRRPGGRLVPAPRRPRRRDRRGRRRRVQPQRRRRRPARATPPGSTRSTGCSTPCRGSRPDALVVSLGVDAAADDPESPLLITADGYRAAGERLGGLGRPTVLVQEGGYHLPTLGAARPRRAGPASKRPRHRTCQRRPRRDRMLPTSHRAESAQHHDRGRTE